MLTKLTVYIFSQHLSFGPEIIYFFLRPRGFSILSLNTQHMVSGQQIVNLNEYNLGFLFHLIHLPLLALFSSSIKVKN